MLFPSVGLGRKTIEHLQETTIFPWSFDPGKRGEDIFFNQSIRQIPRSEEILQGRDWRRPSGYRIWGRVFQPCLIKRGQSGAYCGCGRFKGPILRYNSCIEYREVFGFRFHKHKIKRGIYLCPHSYTLQASILKSTCTMGMGDRWHLEHLSVNRGQSRRVECCQLIDLEPKDFTLSHRWCKSALNVQFQRCTLW